MQADHKGLSGPFSFGVGVLLLLLAPLIRGGNRHVALMALEWISLLLLWLLIAHPLLARRAPSQALEIPAPGRLSRAEWLLLLSPVIAAVFFLIPVPSAIWHALPGREAYSFAAGQSWLAVTLTPDATVTSLLAGIPIAAAFLWARRATPSQFMLLPKILVLSACIQAVWGLLQVGPLKKLYFQAEFAGNAIGSFANANHFANYLAMCLPLAAFLLWQTISGFQRHSRKPQPAATALWSVALFALLSGVIASASRTGTSTALLVLLLTVGYLLTQATHRFRLRHLLLAGGLLLAVLATVGVSTFLARLGSGTLGADALLRWREVESSWQGAMAFWPVGAGPGSFASVYPQFQPPGLGGFLDHAHNDYVQGLFEAGALAAVVGALLLWLAIRQAQALWHQSGASTRVNPHLSLQICCGFSLIAIVLHSFLDFNLHIPANAMLSAALLGAFLRRN